MTKKQEETKVLKQATPEPSEITEVAEAPPKPPTRRRKSKYINKAVLLAATMKAKEQGHMTDELAKLLQLLTSQYGSAYRFASYSYNDDMQSYAMMMLVRTWDRFNPERSDNAFAFYTQCIKNSFKQYLKDEKKHRNVRDELLLDKGLTPSFTFQMEKETTNPYTSEPKQVTAAQSPSSGGMGAQHKA